MSTSGTAPARDRTGAMRIGNRYADGQFQLLMDMHVPDWDDHFLRGASAVELVDAYGRCNPDGVMVFANSHTGECFYPTRAGRFHTGLDGRDLFGQQLELLRSRGIGVCAYFSANWNLRAWRDHPDWRLALTDALAIAGSASRYASCCPNNPDFMDFQIAQVNELAGNYEFDSFFFDMVFWSDVCVCDHCRHRCQQETGGEIPEAIDWFSADWCRFQSARERWLVESFRALKSAVKALRDVPVYCNSSIVNLGWVYGASLDLLTENELIGGDLAGEPEDFFANADLLSRLSGGRFQYMHNISAYAPASTAMRSPGAISELAGRSSLFGARFLAIDALHSSGIAESAPYDALARIFDDLRPFGPHIGGVPHADVAVYWSQESGVNFAHNGRPLAQDGRLQSRTSPHFEAVYGAVAAIRRAGLAAGVVGRQELDRLSEYPVVVLPNVLRMTADEVECFRSYVAGGGRLYASGYSSLVDTFSGRLHNFQLGDVLGMRLVDEAWRTCLYVQPTSSEISDALGAQDLLSVGNFTTLGRLTAEPIWHPILELEPDCEILGTLTLPYGEGVPTSELDNWATIHGEMPWESTPHPVVLRREFGRGQVVYSGIPLEHNRITGMAFVPGGAESERSQDVFAAIVRRMLGDRGLVRVSGHRDGWVVVRDDSARHQMTVTAWNASGAQPPLPIPIVDVMLASSGDRTFTDAFDIRTGGVVDNVIDAAGDARVRFENLVDLQGIVVRYAAQGSSSIIGPSGDGASQGDPSTIGSERAPHDHRL